MQRYSSNSDQVDCTLSLATPSTRRTEQQEARRSRLSNFCWDFLQTKHTTTDPLLSRRCANCDTTSTPLWRNGPRGPKSLCNACGIRYKKEERRATAAATNNAAIMETGFNYGAGWGPHQGHKYLTPAGAGNEFRFIDDVVSADNDGDSGMQFLSWRLNVTDRPTSHLVYDFTR